MNPIPSALLLIALLLPLSQPAWSQSESQEQSSPTEDTIEGAPAIWTQEAVLKIVQTFTQEWKVANAPTGFTCSVLCGYFGESSVAYDPGQDIVLTTGANAAEAYGVAQNRCYDRLVGSGKMQNKGYAILVVEIATQNGVVAARATVTNACVKN